MRVLVGGGLLLVFAIQLIYGLYYRGIFTFLPGVLGGLPIFEPVGDDREIESGQFAYTALLLVGVDGQYAGGIVSDRLAPERTVTATFAALILVMTLFLPATSPGVAPLLNICALLGSFIYASTRSGRAS